MNKKIWITITVVLAASLVFGLNVWAKGTPAEEGEVVEKAPGVVTKYKEAPMLAEMVAKGELPPVDERLPEDPKVIEPFGDEIPRYGGRIQLFAINEGPYNDMQGGSGRLFRVPSSGIGNELDLATGYEVSEDKKIMTLYLREGAKWSDGAPFTASDIAFEFENIHWNELVPSWDLFPEIEGVRLIDDYAIELHAPKGLGAMLIRIGGDQTTQLKFFFAPKHYLTKWHIDYNPDAAKLAKEEGYDEWWECFQYHFWVNPQRNTELPKMTPWVLSDVSTTNKFYERNPYYWKVDTAGNQLPYIDEVFISFVDQELYELKAVSGEADMAYIHTTLANYTLYKENESKGDYRVITWPGVNGSDVAFTLNITIDDPELRKIYGDVRFRQALSTAINREEINKSQFFGLAIPRQAALLPTSSIYKPEWGENHPYADYDPDEANRLLDEMGLDKRGRNGFRLRPSGEDLLLVVEYAMEKITPVLELAKEYWDSVGVQTLLKRVDGSLLGQHNAANKVHVYAAGVHTFPECVERLEYQWNTWMLWGGFGRPWQNWLNAKMNQVMEEIGEGATLPDNWRRLKTNEKEPLPGEKPPEEIMAWLEMRDEWGRADMGSKRYVDLGQQLFDFQAEKIYWIGTVGLAPNLWIAKNRVGGIPDPEDVPVLPIDMMLGGQYDQIFLKY